MINDTSGMKEIGHMSVDIGKEKGCAILAGINNESDFNDMSYFEKRQKDKKIRKMIKTILKNKRYCIFGYK